MNQYVPPTPQAWSDGWDPELYQFCRDVVLHPWEDILRHNRGERQGGMIPPIMGFGPAIPARLLPLLLHKRLVHSFLGPQPNMVTIILNQAHNKIVFFAAERTQDGTYLEMVRLDQVFSQELQGNICKMLQAGAEAEAMDAICEALYAHGLGRFRPGLLKISDLFFFEAFLQLSKQKHHPLRYLTMCGNVAYRVISERLLYFYPEIPVERLLSVLRKLLPAARYQKN